MERVELSVPDVLRSGVSQSYSNLTFLNLLIGNRRIISAECFYNDILVRSSRSGYDLGAKTVDFEHFSCRNVVDSNGHIHKSIRVVDVL